jgi:hypothetical protein
MRRSGTSKRIVQKLNKSSFVAAFRDARLKSIQHFTQSGIDELAKEISAFDLHAG